LRKATISFVMSARPSVLRLSVRTSAWNKSAPTERIFMKFDIWRFFLQIFLTTPHTCYSGCRRSCVGWGETAVVDTEERAACCKHSLTSFQVLVCCGKLESVSRLEDFIVLLPFIISYCILHNTRT